MSRGIRNAVLIALTLVLAGPVSVPPAAATTTVSTEGTVVTMHVPIDFVIVGADVVTASQRQNIVDLATMAQDFYWNPALKDLEYGDCVTFQLDLQVEVHPDDVQYTIREPTPHQIDWYDDPNVDSFVDDPAEPDHTNDSTSPLDGYVTGQWGDPDIATFVHELGHLLGMGDDYIRVPDDSDQGWHAEDKPGREFTVMGKSIWGRWERRELGDVDQGIVDRLGELVGEVEGLPECWTGTMHSETERVYTTPERTDTCTDAWDTEIRFVLADDGSVTGDAMARLSEGPACSFPLLIPIGTEVALSLRGTANSDGFQLWFIGAQDVPTGGVFVAGFTANFAPFRGGGTPASEGPILEIRKTGPCSAERTVTVEDTLRPGQPVNDTFTSVNTIELVCATESAGAGV